MSLYVHVPFCEALCYYCACNKIITKHHERAQTYLQYLEKEVACRWRIAARGRRSASCTWAAVRRPFCPMPS
jgi:oxygen-independent coproporphyrinogen-3 oxidase